jgi:hypothetical protein
MVERFNGRIAELLRSTHFRSAYELSTALGHIPPNQALGAKKSLSGL